MIDLFFATLIRNLWLHSDAYSKPVIDDWPKSHYYFFNDFTIKMCFAPHKRHSNKTIFDLHSYLLLIVLIDK